MQVPHECTHFTQNSNLNKTCNNEKRCLLISYSHKCKDYTIRCDTGFYDMLGNYIENIEDILEEEI